MSVSALPEWKQLLLERKRREEEERERREREEEERLASMPAWKRGIIQRRRAKQESGGERDKEGGQQSVADRNTDTHCDDRLILRQTDAETEPPPKTHNQVSLETIGPIHQNPFIRSQNSYRRENRWRETESYAREKDREIAYEKKSGEETDIEKEESQGQERDIWKGREREMRVERTRDRSEGRERVGTDIMRDTVRGKWDGERDATCLPQVPGLRTIKAENIIIIEKDSKSSEREVQREKIERDRERAAEEERKGMRMDLREFLASGGNVTEIRASEILIIKPSLTEEKTVEGEPGSERKGSKENITMNEKEKTREVQENGVMKEVVASPRTSVDLHEESCRQDESGIGAGRVSQILSKFGQHPKPPCRSKSTDCFVRPGKENSRLRLKYETEEERNTGTDVVGCRGVPKRSFSFSENVLCVCEEKKVVERAFSDRRPPPPVVVKNEQSGSAEMGKGRTKNEQQMVMQRKRDIEDEMEKEEKRVQESRAEREKEEWKDRERKEAGIKDINSEEVFSTASVRNPEGIAFARRIPIRQDRRESKRFVDESERKKTTERDVMRGQETETERQKKWREITEKGRQSKFHIEERAESVSLRDGEGVKVVEESLCLYTPDSHPWCNSHSVLGQRADSQHSTVSNIRNFLPGVKPKGESSSADYCRQNIPSQHTEQLLSKTGRMQDTGDNIPVETRRDNNAPESKEKEHEKNAIWHEKDDHRGTANAHCCQPTLSKRGDEAEPSAIKSPKHTSWKAGVSHQEIRIPRSVFFGVEELADVCKTGLPVEDGQTSGGEKGRGVERKESWKAGRPLTRVESLRERIRQREMERQRRGEAEGEGEKEIGRSDGEGMEKKGERSREAEGAPKAMMLNRQEATSPQTLSPFDVTKEATVSSACHQLPSSVPLSLSQSLSAGQEAQKLPGEDRHYSEQDEEFGSHQDHDSLTRASGEEGGTEEDLLEEEYLCPSHSPSPPISLSPTPSPPLPHSLVAMSRIYKLKNVGSQTTVCISERNTETHNMKVFPDGRFTPISHSVTQSSICSQDRVTLGSDRTARSSQPTPNTETSVVQSVGRQLEQLQLREQEVKQSSHGERDAQCPQKDTEGNAVHGQKRPESQQLQMPVSSIASSSHQTGMRIQTKLPQPKPFTFNARNTQSPENIQKAQEQAITPSSPSSPSSISLLPSRPQSSPVFSIRSASAGRGKRSNTITITPKKPATVSSVSPAPSGITSTPQTPAHEPKHTVDGCKKRYPTADEIEVIGGFQNLENSCLVRNKGMPKGVNVHFDESQLERVCEYPSEKSVLAALPQEEQASDEMRRAEGEGNGQEEEEDEESGVFVSGSAKVIGTGTGTARVLRVDESCRH